MKKKIKVIVIVCIVLLSLIIVSFGGYVYYEFCVPDDYGKQYNQNWQSCDGQIEFVVCNSKGFMGHNWSYDGSATLDGEKITISLGFASGCEMTTDDGETQIFYGDYSYNPFFNQVTVNISAVDDSYSDYYKVGDKLVLAKK